MLEIMNYLDYIKIAFGKCRRLCFKSNLRAASKPICAAH